MKTLFITILFTPFFLFSQGPSFLVTDNNGTVWNSNDLLEQGTTIVVTFFSPSTTCWPSVNHIINTNVAYEKFNPCNDIFFIQVAQWGGEFTVSNFVEDFGNPEIPYVIGYYQGQTLTIEWMDWGLQWAYESWLLRTDGSYEYDIPYVWDLEQTTLVDLLLEEGFEDCDEHSVGDNDHFFPFCCTHCEAMGELVLQPEICIAPIYDLQGRVLKKKPRRGLYLQGSEKFFIK
jgi:hypothetical protein